MVELVIKISKDSYEATCNGHMLPPDVDNVVNAIKQGTPLPEHHGRLMILSETKVKENQINLDFSCQKWIGEVDLSNATVAIIEAEKEK